MTRKSCCTGSRNTWGGGDTMHTCRTSGQNTRQATISPHIYTEDERRRFLEAVDSYPWTPGSSRNTVDPVLFRFLCGTGCRLSEALNLRIADFDYPLGAVTVRYAKNGRSRTVPLCSSLTERIHSYINGFHMGCSGDAYLFPGAKKGKMDRSTAYTHFRDYLLMAGIPHPKDGPRIHDWRYPNQNKIQTFF